LIGILGWSGEIRARGEVIAGFFKLRDRHRRGKGLRDWIEIDDLDAILR
jgi:hypothetical protein